MYGCFVTEPDDAGADLGVVFFHNEGYSTACGHGTIALVTWALESGRLPITGPETSVTVDVPSGRLACVARIDADGSHVAAVRFRNVPAFVLARDVPIADPRGARSAATSATAARSTPRVDARGLGLDVSTGQPRRRSSHSSASSGRRSTRRSTSSTPTSPSCAASTA